MQKNVRILRLIQWVSAVVYIHFINIQNKIQNISILLESSLVPHSGPSSYNH